MPKLLTTHILCLSFEYFSGYRAGGIPASGALDLMAHSSNYKVQESSLSFPCFFFLSFLWQRDDLQLCSSFDVMVHGCN